MNTTDLRLSSTTSGGEGIAEFVQLVAATAMGMPHVNQSIPASYVDLGVQLQTWACLLMSTDEPPVCTRDAGLRRTISCLIAWSTSEHAIAHLRFWLVEVPLYLLGTERMSYWTLAGLPTP